MLPPPNTIGEGTFEPNEVDADRLFEKIERRTAELILEGPSLDALDWYWLLLNGADQDYGDAA